MPINAVLRFTIGLRKTIKEVKMKKKFLITISLVLIGSFCMCAYAEQKQYLQVAKEKEIKERQIQQEHQRERTQRLMDRVYGDRNPYVEFKTDYNPDELPRRCWGGPCRD